MACPACTPELAASPGRRDEGHYAVHLGADWSLTVLKDDATIVDCYEVDVRTGRAWRFRQPLQRCECGGGVEAYIDTGRFAVIRPEGT
jgi:hypothetical protein